MDPGGNTAMFDIVVNNRKIEAEPGETILSALTRAGIQVPTLCHMKKLTPTGACRICVVEVEGRAGLVPSCSTPVEAGMRISTNSPRVIDARKLIIELLLADHPDDCLYCVRSGNCKLQKFAQDYGVRERIFRPRRRENTLDVTSPAIVFDQSKCILCGKCVRTCTEIQGVSAIEFTGRGGNMSVAPAFHDSLNVSSCIYCGQCILACPTGALREKSSLNEVAAALADPGKFVVIQYAPALTVSLAEEFGMKPGTDLSGVLNTALRRMGFQRVFDTSFSADLMVMEEAAELVARLKSGKGLPMFTSCSPGWIKFIEEFYPEFIPNLSSCKSPQAMLGALIKSYYAEREGMDPHRIFSVSAMPCTAKKFESARPEIGVRGLADIDAVLTTRELARMIRMSGIDFEQLEPEEADPPFGERSTAGKLSAASGGVMEAALRTVYKLLTGKELKSLKIDQVRGADGLKETKLRMGGMELGIVVVNGVGHARELLEQIKSGRRDLHFVEVMTCPGGCVAGGGQPINIMENDRIRARASSLYAADQSESLRTSHDNSAVQQLYKEFLKKTGSAVAMRLLHTVYDKRDVPH